MIIYFYFYPLIKHWNLFLPILWALWQYQAILNLDAKTSKASPYESTGLSLSLQLQNSVDINNPIYPLHYQPSRLSKSLWPIQFLLFLQNSFPHSQPPFPKNYKLLNLLNSLLQPIFLKSPELPPKFNGNS